MSDSLSLEVLFRLLPTLPALAELRAGLLTVASVDPGRRWAGSSDYSTVDQRIVTTESLTSLFSTAEMLAVGETRNLYRTVHDAVIAVANGRQGAALDGLVLRGEAAVAMGRFEEALPYFDVAERLARETDDIAATAHAARRIGRAWLHLGDTERAASAYQRALLAADAAGDRGGRISALIGVGHVAAVRGRWADAEAAYHEGLDALSQGPLHTEMPFDPSEAQLRAQLCINIATACREQGRLEEAARYIAQAGVDRKAMSQADESVWQNARGMVLMLQGDLTGAGTAFQQALATAPSHHDSAMILDNLADAAMRRGELREAEQFARRAEEFAVAGAAPRALTEIYTRLGRIMHLRRDDNGIAFFEKAIELARENNFPLAEAHACRAYAAMRRDLGDVEEAEELERRAAAVELSMQG